MPKLKAIIDGPAVGRGQKVSYLLIGQDLGQISGKYGKDDLETVISTTACKIILSQNNEQTAQRFSKMIGNKTVQTTSYSKNEGGLGKGSNPFAKKRVLSASGHLGHQYDPAAEPADAETGCTDAGVSSTGRIMADSPRWYLDSTMKKTGGASAVSVCSGLDCRSARRHQRRHAGQTRH